jgi:UPF0271 protein
MPWIDLNADVGEIPAALADGSEERLLHLVTSANIACGGHAGTPASMRAVVAIAERLGVAIGAHPSYPDPANFGRFEMPMAPDAIAATVASQVAALVAVGAAVRHVKPHGALYNVAVKDAAVAAAIAAGVRRWRDDVVLVGLAGSTMLDVWEKAGFRVAGEAFADRAYEPDGTLRARRHPDALITDPAAAARQAVEIVEHGRAISITGVSIPVVARTLCVHGDTPGALDIVQAIRAAFAARGIEVRSLA